MDKNKMIIIVLIIVILILAVGLYSIMPNAKEDTRLTINANETVYRGDSIDIVLTDSNNTPISNRTISINIMGNNVSNNYSVKTNENGLAKLKINESEGNYTINCTFSGDDEYNGNSIADNVTIKINQAVITQSHVSSTADNSEPEYGSDSYVDKWDESQQSGSDWAYMHDQPVKSEGGHDYKRMYDEDSGESYWYQMDREYDE